MRICKNLDNPGLVNLTLSCIQGKISNQQYEFSYQEIIKKGEGKGEREEEEKEEEEEEENRVQGRKQRIQQKSLKFKTGNKGWVWLGGRLRVTSIQGLLNPQNHQKMDENIGKNRVNNSMD